MKLSISKKLGILIGILLLLFVIVGGTAYNGLRIINTQIHQVVEVEQPISVVTYEMDINLLRIVSGVLGYLGDRDRSHLERIELGIKNFKEFRQQYAALAKTEASISLGLEVETLFAQFEQFAQALVKRDDEQHENTEILLALIEKWEQLLEDIVQAISLEAETVQAYRKLKAISEIERNLDESQRFLGDYVQTHDSKYETMITEKWQGFRKAYQEYTALQLSLQEQTWAEELNDMFAETAALTQKVIDLEHQNTSDLEAFVQLRRKLGNDLLYTGIIKEIAEKDLRKSAEDSLQAITSVNRDILILLPLGIVFGLSFGILLSRNITRPLRQVVEAASKIAVGDIAVEIAVTTKDEIGVLAAAFRRMVEYINNVANVAEAIADGNLQVSVTPQSDHDVLNTSLRKMVNYVQEVADVTERVAGKDLQVEILPKSGQDILNHSLRKMIKNLDRMMQEVERQSWLKDGLNQMGQELSGDLSLRDVCQKAISFVARYINAGHGTLYAYSEEQDMLALQGTYAFTERTKLSNRYRSGEGVVGQVALERLPILLKHPSREQSLITTGLVNRPPFNTYTFPLIHDNILYGVLEVASSEPFDPLKQAFLNETGAMIATVLFSTIQRDRVKELLHVSQESARAAEEAAREAEQAKEEAQEKAREVQEANARLEEQQQQLQQQSEELQQVNAHLEEQQQQLQQQSEELRQQNENLSKTKAELDKRAHDLELASKYKSEFLANMSHELRTPLNSIILLSKMLSRNERLNEKDVKQVSVIHQAGEELLRLINDILDLSKIEAGKVTINVMEFTTGELFETFRDLFRSVAEEKGLEFHVDNTVDIPIKTDRDKLSQVIRNLLANAFKFTKKGGVTLRTSAVPGHTDMIHLFVADTGIGIPKEKQQIVFEAFQQADGSTSREFGGTGLGLSIAREYVKLLKGTLRLESEEGQGSTFIITLPVALETAQPVDVLEQKGTIPAPVFPKPPVSHPISALAPEDIIDDRNVVTKSDKVILIIEDNAELAQTTMDVTREMGFKVLAALNGRDGLDLAARYRPTGILLDLVLPDINGMEVLRELKSTRELRHIPVHIMSSRERDNSYRASGAIGYFQKPVNDLDIQHAVENLMAVSEKYPKRLLIVEDDDTQREAIRYLLANSDEVNATGVGSEQEAIAEIERGEYDAAIIDLALKDGNGYDICKYIKEHHVMLPVIIYTGRELTEEEERELRKYTDSIIIKTARSYERLSDETALFLHQMYHGEPENTVSPALAARPIETQDSLKGKKILIVDDDVKNVFVLASALENHGATVIDAKNGEAALEKLHQEHDVNLVLMDVMMPVMDGYTAIRQIRKDEQLKHLPIIALTAKALKGDRQKCIQAGADDYLSKPVDYDGLIRLAKAWIEKG